MTFEDIQKLTASIDHCQRLNDQVLAGKDQIIAGHQKMIEGLWAYIERLEDQNEALRRELGKHKLLADLKLDLDELRGTPNLLRPQA